MLIAGILFLASSYIPRERVGGFGNTAMRKYLALKGGEVGGG